MIFKFTLLNVNDSIFQPGFRVAQRFRQNVSRFRQISEHFFFCNLYDRNHEFELLNLNLFTGRLFEEKNTANKVA